MTNEVDYRLSRRQVLFGGSTSVGALTLVGCNGQTAPRHDAQVIVLGAGLAGLQAARLLVSEGLDVLVLEGSERVGGRIRTHQHENGTRSEAGGEQVGASYARILDAASELNVGLSPDNPIRRGTTYAYQGGVYGPDDWKTLPNAPFAPPFAGSSPSGPLFSLASKANPLSNSSDWRDAGFGQYDVSAETFLRSQGLQDAALDTIGHAFNGNSLDSYSMMNLYRSLQLYTQSRGMGPSFSIDGGASKLPNAMAASLPRSVILGRKITKIRVDTNAVVVTDMSGQSYRAEQCICALPFGALRHIEIKANLMDMQRTAITNLPYTQILQIHFQCDTPFWDVDGLPADMWMDGPLERVFMDRDDAGRPTGSGRAWVNGQGATTLATLTDAELVALLKRELGRIRSVKASDIRITAIPRWTTGNQLAGGAYMHWAPGQIFDWAMTMGRSTGRLSFAGEHLSHLHTGMEGAMESGEAAAFALLDV